MEAQLFLDRRAHSGWEALLKAIPDDEFQNLSRSTVPLIAFWMRKDLTPGTRYHFEYKVSSVGHATASHTDLMIVLPDRAEAIEGKSTEPRYELVAAWRARGGMRSVVLDHWVQMIRGVSHNLPYPADLDSCVYQMVHRLASVCSVEKPLRIMTYQIFDIGSGDHAHYATDLRHLASTFRLPDTITLRLHTVKTSLTSQGVELGDMLPGLTEHDRAEAIRKALLADCLFEFGQEAIDIIG